METGGELAEHYEATIVSWVSTFDRTYQAYRFRWLPAPRVGPEHRTGQLSRYFFQLHPINVAWARRRGKISDFGTNHKGIAVALLDSAGEVKLGALGGCTGGGSGIVDVVVLAKDCGVRNQVGDDLEYVNGVCCSRPRVECRILNAPEGRFREYAGQVEELRHSAE